MSYRVQQIEWADRSTWRIVVVTFLSAALLMTLSRGSLAAADSAAAEKQYASGFGAEDAKVRKNRKPDVFVKFAQELVTSATHVPDDLNYQALLFNKAYEFGMAFPEGYAVAINAMERLGDAQPKLRSEADQKLVTALEQQYSKARKGPAKQAAAKQYLSRLDDQCDAFMHQRDYARALEITSKAAPVATAAGDDAAAKVKRLYIQDLAKTARRLEESQKTLAQTPGAEEPAAEAARILIIELERPAEASGFLKAAGGEWPKVGALAVQKTAELNEADSLALGQWYLAQASKALRPGKANALSRAKECYTRYLSLHKSKDANRLNAERALSEQIAPALADAAPPDWGRTIDLLPMIDVGRDVRSGNWKREEGGLACLGPADAPARIGIRYVPPAEYDFRVTFTIRKQGVFGDVNLLFTDGGNPARLIMGGQGNAITGFDNINGKWARANGTAVHHPLNAGQQYTSEVRVRKDLISAWIDGTKLSEHKTDGSDLSEVDGWSIKPLSLGLGSMNLLLFQKVELVEHGGRGKPVPVP